MGLRTSLGANRQRRHLSGSRAACGAGTEGCARAHCSKSSGCFAGAVWCAQSSSSRFCSVRLSEFLILVSGQAIVLIASSAIRHPASWVRSSGLDWCSCQVLLECICGSTPHLQCVCYNGDTACNLCVFALTVLCILQGFSAPVSAETLLVTLRRQCVTEVWPMRRLQHAWLLEAARQRRCSTDWRYHSHLGQRGGGRLSSSQESMSLCHVLSYDAIQA